MKYLILIYHNPQVREAWEHMSEEERAEGLRTYARFMEDLAESGEMVVAEALTDPALAKRVLNTDGAVSTTDGPFSEFKEHLAGFFLVECDSIERAVELGARIPESRFGVIEVRPVYNQGSTDI